MTAPWSLPGYDVEALLGTGSTGEVWRARERSTGQPVALKRLRPGADPDALQHEAQVLAALDSPYLLRLRDVVGEGATAVLVLDLAAGGSLAALLRRRGTLEPGEVVTVAAPLASALAVAHTAGLVHGDVSPSNVLFTDAGKPLLADLGTARAPSGGAVSGTAEYLDPVVAAGGVPTGASDVWSLAAVCHHLLAGSPPHEGAGVDDVLGAASAGRRAPLGLLAPTAPRALVDVVEAALVRDPALRPDADGFAAALREAHAAAPVRFSGPPPAVPVPDVRPTHAVARHAAPKSAADPARPRRKLPRWLVPLALAVVLLTGAAALGWWWGRGPDTGPAATPVGPAPASASPAVAGSAPSASSAATGPEPSASPAAPDWPAVLDELDTARAQAFATADPAALAAVYAPGAPALAADRALVEQLAAAGQRAEGVRHAVREVEPLEVGERRARLRVVDALAGYSVRDAAGAVVTRTAERGPRPFVVELARTADGWRLVQLTPD